MCSSQECVPCLVQLTVVPALKESVLIVMMGIIYQATLAFRASVLVPLAVQLLFVRHVYLDILTH